MQALVLLFLLCGCAGQVPPPIIKTVTVNVPVAVSCVPKETPPPGVYPDTAAALLAALDPMGRLRLLEEGWGLRDDRLTLLERLLANCRSLQP